MRRNHRKGKRRGCSCLSPGVLLRCEWEQYNRRAMVIGGGLLLLAAVGCRIAVGSPAYARHLLRMPGCMPAGLWLGMTSGLLSILLGALFGAMVASPSPTILRVRFHGTVLLVPLCLFRLCWYPLLFGAFSPALALIALGLAIFCGCCALMAFRAASRIAPLVILLELCWCLWLAVATLLILLMN